MPEPFLAPSELARQRIGAEEWVPQLYLGTIPYDLAYGRTEMVARMRDSIPEPMPLPSAVDDELVRRCQRGDREAFRSLVERYADAVFGTALLMTRDRLLAEDLAQEAFISAWRGIRGFRLGSPMKPWLLRIVVNRVLSHRRRRVLQLVPLPWAERAHTNSPSPEATVERLSEYADVRSALAQLPDEHRRVLVLRYYAELSVPGIARATGWREGTVKSRLHRALLRMRELLEANELTEE